jgi:hypothetical protein
MKVLFSNPPWWDSQCNGRWAAGVRAGSRWPFTYVGRSSPDHFVFGDYLPYPFFMGYAATYAARETGADVRFRDSIALKESYQSFLTHLKDERYDYVFLEIATPSWEHDRQTIRQIHETLPECRIVVTGPITTIKSGELLANYPVHACIQGEYEKGSAKVINGASGVLHHELLTAAEMNASPYPYFDSVYAHRYWDANPHGQKVPHCHVWASRGCAFKCIFCVWPATMTGNDPDGNSTRKVRHYSPDYMEAFLKELVGRYNYKSIYFDDDTVNLGNKHVEQMCEVMTRIGLPWSAMCRADTIKMETWKMMREAGCFGVKLGFESGSQYVNDGSQQAPEPRTGLRRRLRAEAPGHDRAWHLYLWPAGRDPRADAGDQAFHPLAALRQRAGIGTARSKAPRCTRCAAAASSRSMPAPPSTRITAARPTATRSGRRSSRPCKPASNPSRESMNLMIDAGLFAIAGHEELKESWRGVLSRLPGAWAASPSCCSRGRCRAMDCRRFQDRAHSGGRLPLQRRRGPPPGPS